MEAEQAIAGTATHTHLVAYVSNSTFLDWASTCCWPEVAMEVQRFLHLEEKANGVISIGSKATGCGGQDLLRMTEPSVFTQP